MNLNDPGELSKLLRKHGLSPDKGLGQHFLCSKKVVDSIVDRLKDVESFLEVGPGPGSLTHVLSRDRPLVAIDLDDRMIDVLAESSPNATVIHGDALEVDLRTLLANLPQPRGLVSNMPYNITGPLLARFADCSEQWSVAVLMMQREVGEKILAAAGDRRRGALSVRMQAEFEIDRVCLVPPGAFVPPPKVESIVLCLKPKETTIGSELVRFVQRGFSQPRKTLANNLSAAGYPKDLVLKAGLAASIRPHELTESDWWRVFESKSTDH